MVAYDSDKAFLEKTNTLVPCACRVCSDLTPFFPERYVHFLRFVLNTTPLRKPLTAF
jgi:hypothetical protein